MLCLHPYPSQSCFHQFALGAFRSTGSLNSSSCPRALSLNTVVINYHHSESGMSVYVSVCYYKSVHAVTVVIAQAVVVKSHHIEWSSGGPGPLSLCVV